jgi:alanine dehydrogenase
MIVGVPKETYPGERRVAMVPSVVPILLKAGCEVLVEKGAGIDAGYEDAAYISKGNQRDHNPGPLPWRQRQDWQRRPSAD